MTPATPHRWMIFAPGIFVFLWSTGFIGAKLGLPYADPLSFLITRFAIVTALLGIVSLIVKAAWPQSFAEAGHDVVVGICFHGLYLGGVFGSIYFGMSAGLSALIVGLQPVLTAAIAKPLLKEDVSARQWGGIVLGFGGLIFVLYDRSGISGTQALALEWQAMALAIIALFGITIGSIYQKRFATGHDLRTAGFMQYLGAFCFLGFISLFVETKTIIWSFEFVTAMVWLVLALSFGAVFLLMQLIRHGEVSKIASLFYLVPPATALIAYFLFGEKLTFVEIIGMGLAAFGVMLATRGQMPK